MRVAIAWRKVAIATLSALETRKQRFGGSLNLNTHAHAVFPDGVFVHESASARAEFVRVLARHLRSSDSPCSPTGASPTV